MRGGTIPRERALVPREDLEWFAEVYPCCKCGKPTHYADLSFIAPLCPWPCYHDLWREYCQIPPG